MLSFECIKNEKSVYFLLTSAEDTTVRKFIGQPSPAPRRSCPKQAGKYHREGVIGQHKSQKRSGCPKYEQKTSREGV